MNQVVRITQEEAIALLDGSAPIEERAEQLGIVEPKKLNKVRSEAAKKAWDTRIANKAKAAAAQSQPTPVVMMAGISAEDAKWTKTLAQQLFEAREEFAAVKNKLDDLEADWNAHIESITAK